MIDIADTPEEALDTYWLCVWRNLVEEYWNYVRRPDEENDPYYKRGVCCKPCYTFESARKSGCKSKEAIDGEVASLAQDFWRRNRLDLKEWFVNNTCNNWPDKDKYEVQRAVFGSNWLDCGVDPVYPNAKNEYSAYNIGIMQSMLSRAIHKAEEDCFWNSWKELASKLRIEEEELAKEKRRARKEKLDRFKKLVSSAFHKIF